MVTALSVLNWQEVFKYNDFPVLLTYLNVAFDELGHTQCLNSNYNVMSYEA